MDLQTLFLNNFNCKKSTGGFWRLNNPFIDKKDFSMAVNFEYGIILCHRTRYKSSIVNFLMEYTGKSYKELFNNITLQPKRNFTTKHEYLSLKLPDNFFFLFENDKLKSRVDAYLNNRKYIDYNVYLKRQFGYCNGGEFFGRIIIPFLNPTLEYYIGRSFIGDEPKYKNLNGELYGIGKSSLFYNELALNEDYIYLCEGVFDACTCGDNGVAMLGSSPSITQISKIINSKCKTVYIVSDYGYRKESLKTALRLIDFKEVYVSNDNYDGNDVSDVGLNALDFTKVDIKYIYNNL